MPLDIMKMLPTLMELGMRKQQMEEESAYRALQIKLKEADDLRAAEQLALDKEKFGYTRQNDRFTREQNIEEAARKDAELAQKQAEFNLKKTGGEAFALAQGGGPTNENSALADVFAADPTSARFIAETPGRKLKERTDQKALDDLISGQKSAANVLESMGVTDPSVLQFVQTLNPQQQLDYIKSHQPQSMGTDEGSEGQFGRYFNPVTKQWETQDLGTGVKPEKLPAGMQELNLLARLHEKGTSRTRFEQIQYEALLAKQEKELERTQKLTTVYPDTSSQDAWERFNPPIPSLGLRGGVRTIAETTRAAIDVPDTAVKAARENLILIDENLKRIDDIDAELRPSTTGYGAALKRWGQEKFTMLMDPAHEPPEDIKSTVTRKALAEQAGLRATRTETGVQRSEQEMERIIKAYGFGEIPYWEAKIQMQLLQNNLLFQQRKQQDVVERKPYVPYKPRVQPSPQHADTKNPKTQSLEDALIKKYGK